MYIRMSGIKNRIKKQGLNEACPQEDQDAGAAGQDRRVVSLNNKRRTSGWDVVVVVVILILRTRSHVGFHANESAWPGLTSGERRVSTGPSLVTGGEQAAGLFSIGVLRKAIASAGLTCAEFSGWVIFLPWLANC